MGYAVEAALLSQECLTFEQMMQQHYGSLYRYVNGRLKDLGKVEDIVQESFIRLYKSLQKGHVIDDIFSWLCRVAHNLCIDFWRSKAYFIHNRSVTSILEQEDVSVNVLNIIEQKETSNELIHYVNRLPEMQRQIIMLRYFQNYKIVEISNILKIPINSVKSSLYRSLNKLEKQLSNSAHVEYLHQ